jgi:phage FluMu gp28-like protein
VVSVHPGASNRCNETIAAARYAGDVSYPIPAITHHPAQVSNLYAKSGVVHEDAWPHTLEDFLLADDIAGALNQFRQNIERTPTHRYGFITFQ